MKARKLVRLAGALVAGLGLTLAAGLLLSEPQQAIASPTGVNRYVAPTGDDSGPNFCTNIITPCRTVQQAVTYGSTDDLILVATGTYTAADAAVAVVYVQEGDTIRGGYSPDFSEWDPEAYPTTLDGRGSMRVIWVNNATGTVLEGLRVFNGLASGSVDQRRGGGIYVNSSSNVVISTCKVFSNSAEQLGGGIFIGSTTSATLQANRVYSNEAGLIGGGIEIVSSDDAMLVDNLVYSNTSGADYGGLVLSGGSDAVLLGNSIYGNSAADDGGGLLIYECTNSLVVNTVVADNQIGGSGEGAGVWIHDGDARLLHTTVARNTGGAGDGILLSDNATASITNTIIASHTVGVRTATGGVVTLTATLWGGAAWANGSDVSGTGIVSGTNYFGDPAFVDPDNDDYHISAGSPAMNVGVNAGIATDIDGEIRLGTPDLGADETWYRVYLPLVLRSY
ncbi:MAG: right-handed parallel beta-helix repeat-containing protein [Anaerolineales bacterium]|nr:MAG: right-handed parallel beta-helix repeat-containing protein [Anaerolineales bacterium]